MSMPPQRHTIKVVEPTAHSDHRAIIASTHVQCAQVKLSEKKIFRRSMPSQHAALLNHLRNYDDSALTSTADPKRAWELFYDTINGWMDKFYPSRQVTITSKDPAYITPDVKYLLRRKNCLMRRTEEASAITIKIGRTIARFNSRALRRLDRSTGTKDLWRCVNSLTKPKDTTSNNQHNLTAEELNLHHALTSTDTLYQEVEIKSTVNLQQSIITEAEVFYMLDSLRPTTKGYDKIPAWYLRILVPVCARSLWHIINISLSHSYVPPQWKTADSSSPQDQKPNSCC